MSGEEIEDKEAEEKAPMAAVEDLHLLSASDLPKETEIVWGGKTWIVSHREMKFGEYNTLYEDCLTKSGDLKDARSLVRLERMRQLETMKKMIISIGPMAMTEQKWADLNAQLVELIRDGIFGSTGIPDVNEVVLGNSLMQSVMLTLISEGMLTDEGSKYLKKELASPQSTDTP